MTDQAAGLLGLLALALIVVFVGVWFGWTVVWWIIGGSAALLTAGWLYNRATAAR